MEPREPEAAEPQSFDDALIRLGRSSHPSRRARLVSSPLLAALRRAGTRHVYADTADVEELGALLGSQGEGQVAEIDGNTANQPLVNKVIDRYLDQGDAAAWARELRGFRRDLDEQDLAVLVYAIVCGRAGADAVAGFAAGREWEVSLQLHMRLGADAEASKRVGRWLRAMVPPAIVKVPFTPHYPHCFLIARDLEREGIPVNFTSTFSARQVAAAAILANVARTNVFMGRLNQGLDSRRIGEHVDLEAQRLLRRLRRDDGLRTELIVASVREWRTFDLVAGCDVFTAPCEAIRELLEQDGVPPDEIRSRLETSYEDELGVSERVRSRLGAERIARLYRVEPEFVEFLRDLRGRPGYDDLSDGDELYRRFDDAGFGDFFHAPDEGEWKEIRRGKLPDLEGDLVDRIPLDTLYSLLADGDFEKQQDEMDGKILERLRS